MRSRYPIGVTELFPLMVNGLNADYFGGHCFWPPRTHTVAIYVWTIIRNNQINWLCCIQSGRNLKELWRGTDALRPTSSFSWGFYPFIDLNNGGYWLCMGAHWMRERKREFVQDLIEEARPTTAKNKVMLMNPRISMTRCVGPLSLRWDGCYFIPFFLHLEASNFIEKNTCKINVSFQILRLNKMSRMRYRITENLYHVSFLLSYIKLTFLG